MSLVLVLRSALVVLAMGVAAFAQEFPSARVIAAHYLADGPETFDVGYWRVEFENTGWTSGDMALAAYDVTIRYGSGWHHTLAETYRKRLVVQFGSLECMAMVTGRCDEGKPCEWLSDPPMEELDRRQQAGECPDLVLRLWSVAK